MNDSANDGELLEAMLAAAPNVGRAALANSLYRDRVANAVIGAAHEASYLLIDALNEFCVRHGVEYFALAKTLAGACSYADFIPGTTQVELGMLREDYLKFEAAYYAEGGRNVIAAAYPPPSKVLSMFLKGAVESLDTMTADDEAVVELESARDDSALKRSWRRVAALGDGPDEGADEGPGGNSDEEMPADLGGSVSFAGEHLDVLIGVPRALPFELASHFDEERALHRRMPVVYLPGCCMVKQDGARLYGSDHFPLVFGSSIQISVFDAMPDDYDASRMLFWELKALDAGKGLASRLPARAAAALYSRAWHVAAAYNDRPHREVARLVPTRSQPIAIDCLKPTRMLDFGTTRISCPRKGDIWVVQDVELQQRQVEILQSDAAAIVREIDRICRANGIGYFVCGGTMLGLVRHGGFIPWDDDMDVGMLRADYERFLEVAAREIDSSRFFLQTRESDPNIPYLFSKVRLRDSSYVTKYNQFRDFDKGICVDIFPFDRVPFETGELPAFKRIVRQVTRAHNKLANRQVGDMPSVQPATLRDRVAREVMSARHSWYWKRSLADTQRDYEDTVTQFNGDERLRYVASFVPTFTMVHLDDLLPYQDVEFAGMTLSAPARPEVFLQMQYGDFMTMPQPHQQRGHNLIWWSDPSHDSAEFGGEPPEHAPVEHHESKLLAAAPAAAAGAAACAAAAVVAGVAKMAGRGKRGR